MAAATLAAVPRLLVDSSTGALVREGIRRRTQPAVLRHLEGTLHVLKDRGWVQGELVAETGCVCLRQAVQEATDAGFGTDGTSAVVHWVLRLMVLADTGGDSQDVFAWNDTPGRTEDEVLQLIEDGISLVRGYEGGDR